MTENPFKPAVRANLGIYIAIAGASGSGKTKSALELAVGLAGPDGKIAVIDTEGRRALFYADEYKFDHCDLGPPYTPERVTELIVDAQDRLGYDVVIVDSFSDEYEGEGGLTDMAEAEAIRMATDRDGSVAEWKIEAMGGPSWRKPKIRHKKAIVRRMRDTAKFVIFCLRAEEKVQFIKDGGKTRIVPIGWQPICEKRFMYDMTVSFTMAPDGTRGMPRYDLPCKIKDEFKPFFPEGKHITRRAGEQLRAWVTGAPIPGASPPKPAAPAIPVERGTLPDTFKNAGEFIDWSTRYLADATPDEATAWEAKYRDRLGKLAERDASAAMGLTALFGERVGAGGKPAADDVFPGDL